MSRRRSFFESRNPVMKDKIYQEAAHNVLDANMTQAGIIRERMTVQGAINKSLLLGGIMLLTAAISFYSPSPLFMWGGAIGGLIVVVIASFRPQYSPTLAPLYAALEGLFVGAIPRIQRHRFSGGYPYHGRVLPDAVHLQIPHHQGNEQIPHRGHHGNRWYIRGVPHHLGAFLIRHKHALPA